MRSVPHVCRQRSESASHLPFTSQFTGASAAFELRKVLQPTAAGSSRSGLCGAAWQRAKSFLRLFGSFICWSRRALSWLQLPGMGSQLCTQMFLSGPGQAAPHRQFLAPGTAQSFGIWCPHDSTSVTRGEPGQELLGMEFQQESPPRGGEAVAGSMLLSHPAPLCLPLLLCQSWRSQTGDWRLTIDILKPKNPALG